MSRPPPAKNRRMTFVNLALYYAEDDSHGYSQKPPSGRWGPDYDCSSLLYFLAEKAGYPVGSGGDKVRYTGTMLKDFEKAGFQILPFANVGISDLKIGDILLNLALHAEVYVGNGESVGATTASRTPSATRILPLPTRSSAALIIRILWPTNVIFLLRCLAMLCRRCRTTTRTRSISPVR